MNWKDAKRDAWTIPNILTYIRLLLVPVVMWLVIDERTYIRVSDKYAFAFIALGVMAFAMFTDLIDGVIARKFNQVTEFGKVIDPLADKFMHAMTVLALCIAVMDPVYWAIMAVILFKEATMLVLGTVIALKKTAVQAVLIGKIASAFLSFAIFSGFFHEFWYGEGLYLDYVFLGVGTVLSLIAFSYYVKMYLPVVIEVIKDRKNKGAVNENVVENDTETSDNNADING